MKRIIFVCTGNTCRSPMAEAIANKLFKEKNIVCVVSSRGLSVSLEMPISENSAKALKAHGIEYTSHTAAPLTEDDIVSADLILTMTRRLKNMLLTFAPSLRTKVYSIYEYITGEDRDINDPFGQDYCAYENCFNELYALLEKFRFKEIIKMIGLGCDHGGYALKNTIIKHLKEMGYEYKDFGTYSDEPTDYPIYAKAVANAVVSGEVDKGILICGTGIGVSIAANKVKGVRAALCHDVFSAKATREHNDANILAMGARVIGPGLALEIVDAFLAADFSNDERHIRRNNMLEEVY